MRALNERIDQLQEHRLEGSPAAVVVANRDRSVLRALGHWPRLDLGY